MVLPAYTTPAELAAHLGVPERTLRAKARAIGACRELGKTTILLGAWNNVCKRARIERLTPHCCRHGFATTMLHKGYDVKTVAEMGGWKDAQTVLRSYAHAVKDRTVTNTLFDTPVTQGAADEPVTISEEKEKHA